MKAIVSALVLALAVTGCSLPAQLKSSPAVRYYVLSSPLPASSSTESAGIGVLPVTLPGYLTRQQIVLRDGDVLKSAHFVTSRPAGDTIQSMVEAESLLIRDLADNIARSIRR